MPDRENSTKNTGPLSMLPSVDALLRSETAKKLLSEAGIKQLTVMARRAIEELRNDPPAETFSSKEEVLQAAERRLETIFIAMEKARLQKVINATGVIIHTNLGRAPLSENAVKAVSEAAGYCTLEYDLNTGKRGRRGARAEKLLADLTGAESALIVNNCAAAAYLVLSALAGGAQGGETIISRGELVEIGGDFRIPDVMKQAGTTLVEVGTTNRTRVSDYSEAVNENTRLIARVHPSNYRIIGFTAAPSVAELAALAHEHGLLFFEDAGSGALPDLTFYGLEGEPKIGDSIDAGADVVTFSGDKLLGGLQTGLIVGRAEVIDRLRKHPLYRVLRCDKLVYAALEATLESYLRGTENEDIPVLKMLALTKEQLRECTEKFVENLRALLGENSVLSIDIIDGFSAVGGGAAPEAKLETSLIVLTHRELSANQLEETLRLGEPPVITRVIEDKVAIDLRTVSENDEADLMVILSGLA